MTDRCNGKVKWDNLRILNFSYTGACFNLQTEHHNFDCFTFGNALQVAPVSCYSFFSVVFFCQIVIRGSYLWGVFCVQFNIYNIYIMSVVFIEQTTPTCMHNMPSCKHNMPLSCMHVSYISMHLQYANMHAYISKQNSSLLCHNCPTHLSHSHTLNAPNHYKP